MATDDPVIVLHRYYLQATFTRRTFEETMRRHPRPPEFGSEAWLEFMTAMGLWYGAVYAVVEGWRDYVKLSDPAVDAAIADPKVDKLRLYRNAVFHFQAEYLSPKMMAAIDEEQFVPWVTQLHKELGRFFLAYIDAKRIARKAAEA